MNLHSGEAGMYRGIDEKAQILEMLTPLFKKADAEGLWFYCSYQSMWFSPAELREAQANGKFVWGPVNWQLLQPSQRVAELEDDIVMAKRALEMFKARL